MSPSQRAQQALRNTQADSRRYRILSRSQRRENMVDFKKERKKETRKYIEIPVLDYT